MINKLIILALVITFPVEYKEMDLYFLSHYIDQEECINNLNSIPDKYLEGINSISFFDIRKPVKAGHYFYFAQKIDIFVGCDMSTIVHEVAHHKNKIDKVSFRDSYLHKEPFDQAFKEIADAR